MWRGLTLALVASAQAGLIGKYYDSKDWTGKFHFRVDDGVNFDWGNNGPRIRNDLFSVIWEGTVSNAAVTTIITDCDDGVQLYIDNKLVIDSLEDPYDPFPKSFTGAINGKSFKLKYFENYGQARCKVRYSNTAVNWAAWDTSGRAIDQFPVIPGAWFTAAAKPTGPDATEVVEVTEGNIAQAKWYTLASIQETTTIRVEHFYDGLAPYAYDYSNEFIRKCGDFELLGITETDNAKPALDRVIVKVTMGKNVDYFRPTPNTTLCDMLRSNSLHEWAPAESGPWYTSQKFKYNRWALGGSDDWQPHYLSFTDWRAYPAFWGAGEGAGCCYYDADPEGWKKPSWERGGRAWRRAFKMEVKSTLRKPYVPPADLTVTGTDGSWTVLAQVGDGLELKDKAVFTKGWNEDVMSKHAQFIRACSKYDAWGHNVVVKMRFGRYALTDGKPYDPDLNAPWQGELIAFYRPVEGKTLCDMLTSNQNHEWSDSGAALEFYQPDYQPDDKLCGGSVWGWPKKDYAPNGRPKDFNLAHLPFWCGNTGAFGNYFKSSGGDGSWVKSFQLLVKQQARPDPTEGDLASTGGYVTRFLHLGSATQTISTTSVEKPLFKDSLGLCGQDWHYYNQYCYQVSETTLNYTDAEKDCASRGASLVAIHSAGENTFINLLADGTPWIDGTDLATQGTWVHGDKTPFDFTDWQPGEPNGGTWENCLQMVNWGDKKWIDNNCGNKNKFVCKKPNKIAQPYPKIGQQVVPVVGTPSSGTSLTWTKITNLRPPYVWSNGGMDKFVDYYALALYSPTAQKATLTTRHDDGLYITLESVGIYLSKDAVWEDKKATFDIAAGWNQMILKFSEVSGNNYFWLKIDGQGLKWKYEK